MRNFSPLDEKLQSESRKTVTVLLSSFSFEIIRRIQMKPEIPSRCNFKWILHVLRLIFPSRSANVIHFEQLQFANFFPLPKSLFRSA